MEPDGRFPKADFDLHDHDEEVQKAWFGSEWQQKYSVRCSTVAFCATYGGHGWALEAGIEKFLTPAFMSFRARSLARTKKYVPGVEHDLSDPWVGFGHAAEARWVAAKHSSGEITPVTGATRELNKAARCEWCGKRIRYHSSAEPLRIHRRKCSIPPRGLGVKMKRSPKDKNTQIY